MFSPLSKPPERCLARSTFCEAVLSNSSPVHQELLLLGYARNHNKFHSCWHAIEMLSWLREFCTISLCVSKLLCHSYASSATTPCFIATLFPGFGSVVLSTSRIWIARTYVAAQKECKDNRARRQDIPERPAKRSHRITAACSEPSAPSNLPEPSGVASDDQSAGVPAAPSLGGAVASALGSDWVLLNTQTLTVHYCVSSQCVASGCGKYLLGSSQALRPSKLRGHGLFTCALCFGKREAIPAHP